MLLTLLALSVPAAAGAKTLAPKRGTAFFGVTDRGSTAEFEEFEGLVGKHPPVLETFHPYGNTLNEAILRWEQTEVRPMLHISTGDDQTLMRILCGGQLRPSGRTGSATHQVCGPAATWPRPSVRQADTHDERTRRRGFRPRSDRTPVTY